MKIISISMLSVLFTVSLVARTNPFEPTDHFLEQKEMIIKANELEEQAKIAKELEEKRKTQKKLEAEELEAERLAQKEAEEKAKMLKELEAKKAQELEAKKLAKKQAEMKAAKIAKELEAKRLALLQAEAKKAQELAKKKTMVKDDVKTLQIVGDNMYKPEIKENFEVLPFVKVYILNDVLTIEVDKKYKLLNQDILKLSNKILFDFKGKKSFYTIRKMITNENFKSFAVGTHMKKNFFRVVVELPENVSNYQEVIDSDNGIITIEMKQ